MVKRTPIKSVSQKQALLNARWLGIKDERLYQLGDEAECSNCGAQGFWLDADHITPRGRGGTYDPDNMELLCRGCHQQKHGNLPEWSATE